MFDEMSPHSLLKKLEAPPGVSETAFVCFGGGSGVSCLLTVNILGSKFFVFP